MLRLEHLFNQLQHYLKGGTRWDSRIFLSTVMDILDLFSRGDIKTELIKETERAANNLAQHLQHPGVDRDRLESILRALERLDQNLHAIQGQLGQAIRDNEFITVIRQRSSIPGGTCDFDLPIYHQWLEQKAELRQQEQSEWYATFDPVRQSVELLLKLIRNSAEPHACEAINGSYQQSLESSIPFQMIRIALPQGAPYFAEVSGGKHRFTIRFLVPGEGRPVQSNEDIGFKLSCCSL
jgi:cell division protein ZapD